MPNYLLALVACMALFIQCEKETVKTPGFRISLRDFSNYTPGITTDVYCLVTREDGSIVGTKHVVVQPLHPIIDVEVEDVSESEILDITVFTNMHQPNWYAYTWRKIPSGAVLSRNGLVSNSTSLGVLFNFPIIDVPALDSIEVPGGSYGFQASPSGPNLFLEGNVFNGNNGLLIRVKPGGQTDWQVCWQPVVPKNTLFHTPVPYSKFKSDLPKRTLTLPYPSANWSYSIAGVVQDTGVAGLTCLTEKNATKPDQLLVSTVTFDDPPELNAQMYSVFALELADSITINSYQFLLQPDQLTVPPVDFGVASATLIQDKNLFRLEIIPFGSFDVVTARLYGNNLFSNWTVMGSPGDLASFTLPVWPSDWPIPTFTRGTGRVYTNCDDYQSFKTFQEALANLNSDALWHAKAGWRRHSGY